MTQRQPLPCSECQRREKLRAEIREIVVQSVASRYEKEIDAATDAVFQLYENNHQYRGPYDTAKKDAEPSECSDSGKEVGA